MCLILSHIGKKLPNHLYNCIEQTKKHFDGKIYLITDSPTNDLEKKFDIEVISPNFSNEKFLRIIGFNFYTYPSKEFWLYSLARFFFIEEFVEKNDIKNFVMFENDVLIYYNLNELMQKLIKTDERIFFTIGDETRITTGFSFFKHWSDLKKINDDIIDIIQNQTDLIDVYQNYSSCCPSEMVFLRKISKDKKYINPLPLFPEDKYYEELNFVFDPAGYGQFLGGTSAEMNGGDNYIDENTYIGLKLKQNIYRVFFDEKEKYPYLLDSFGKRTRLFNLHIHSKNLKKFM
jgi:hypothetical protein